MVLCADSRFPTGPHTLAQRPQVQRATTTVRSKASASELTRSQRKTLFSSHSQSSNPPHCHSRAPLFLLVPQNRTGDACTEHQTFTPFHLWLYKSRIGRLMCTIDASITLLPNVETHLQERQCTGQHHRTILVGTADNCAVYSVPSLACAEPRAIAGMGLWFRLRHPFNPSLYSDLRNGPLQASKHAANTTENLLLSLPVQADMNCKKQNGHYLVHCCHEWSTFYCSSQLPETQIHPLIHRRGMCFCFTSRDIPAAGREIQNYCHWRHTMVLSSPSTH